MDASPTPPRNKRAPNKGTNRTLPDRLMQLARTVQCSRPLDLSLAIKSNHNNKNNKNKKSLESPRIAFHAIPTMLPINICTMKQRYI